MELYFQSIDRGAEMEEAGLGGVDLSQKIAVQDMENQVSNLPTHHGPTGSLLQIPISLQVILGGTKMALSKVMSLGQGSIISLDQKLSEPVQLLVNGTEFARGTIVVVDEITGQLGINLTDVSSQTASLKLRS